MFIGWHGRTAAVLVTLTAIFAFVYSLAKGAPVGVIAFTSVYLLLVAINAVRYWRGRRNARSRPSRPGTIPIQ